MNKNRKIIFVITTLVLILGILVYKYYFNNSLQPVDDTNELLRKQGYTEQQIEDFDQPINFHVEENVKRARISTIKAFTNNTCHYVASKVSEVKNYDPANDSEINKSIDMTTPGIGILSITNEVVHLTYKDAQTSCDFICKVDVNKWPEVKVSGNNCN